MMNPNIVFGTAENEVSIFKLDISKPMPFDYELLATVSNNKGLINIYLCTIGSKHVEVANGDYIVIGTNTIYFNGECRVVEDIRVITEDILVKRYIAVDTLSEQLVDIVSCFNDEETEETEPTDEEILAIEEDLEWLNTEMTEDEEMDDFS